MQKKSIAIFDFDGTISPKDSFIEFIRFSNGDLKLIACVLLNSPFIVLYLLKLYPSQKLKEIFFSFFFKGSNESELKQKGNDFCIKILPGICYASALKVIQWHREQAHEIYILTASSAIWLDEWCKENNLVLIGTEFETLNGVYSGKIKGKNCKGKEKAERIKFLFQENNIAQAFGYGNDKSDKYFLEKTNSSFNKSLSEENVKKYWNLETV